MFSLSNIISVLLCLNLKLAFAYQDFSVHKLCPNSPLLSTFNQIYNNRPGIQLFNQSDSAAFVHEIWTPENIDQFQDCVFTVDSNLYSPDGGRYGRGIFASVHTLNLRQDANKNCIDYIRFNFDGARTEKICGRFTFDDEIGQHSFFNDGAGIMKIHIFVNKTIPFHTLQRSIEVNLLFTAYEPCTVGRNLVRCIPNNDGFCIANEFKNDNVQNCPPPHSGDEINKNNQNQNWNQNKNKQQNQQSTNNKSSNGVAHNHIEYHRFSFIAIIALFSRFIF